MLFSTCLFVYNAETAFLGAQIAPKSLSAEASPQTPLGELTELPRSPYLGPTSRGTAKKTNEWVLNKTEVKRELLDTVKRRKLAYYGHTMRKQGSCLEKEIMHRTMPGARRRGRLRTAWMDNIKTWTGLSVEESVRMTEDRDKWIEDG